MGRMWGWPSRTFNFSPGLSFISIALCPKVRHFWIVAGCQKYSKGGGRLIISSQATPGSAVTSKSILQNEIPRIICGKTKQNKTKRLVLNIVLLISVAIVIFTYSMVLHGMNQ